MLMASFVFAEIDNDTAELIALVEQVKAVKEVKTQVEITNGINSIKEHSDSLVVIQDYISQRLFQLELHPKFMASRLAYRNTFMWYIWNDFDEAKGFNKLEIAEQIYNLTK